MVDTMNHDSFVVLVEEKTVIADSESKQALLAGQTRAPWPVLTRAVPSSKANSQVHAVPFSLRR